MDFVFGVGFFDLDIGHIRHRGARQRVGHQRDAHALRDQRHHRKPVLHAIGGVGLHVGGAQQGHNAVVIMGSKFAGEHQHLFPRHFRNRNPAASGQPVTTRHAAHQTFGLDPVRHQLRGQGDGVDKSDIGLALLQGLDLARGVHLMQVQPG